MTKIKVQPNEVTCLSCGETFPADWSGCPRCSLEDDAERKPGQYKRTPTVPTISYLKPGEYVNA
jgi:hypothetical protein